MQQTRSSRVHRRDIMNNAPKHSLDSRLRVRITPEPPELKHHQLVIPGLEESLRHQEQPIVRTRPTTHTAEAESETCYSRPLIAAAWSRASLSTQGSVPRWQEISTAIWRRRCSQFDLARIRSSLLPLASL